MMRRRRFGQVCAAALLSQAYWARAQAHLPRLVNGPLRVVVGFPAGGATDIVARNLQERLSRLMPDQVVIVDNRPGAGGQIAAQTVKNAPPDGSVVFLSLDHTQVIIPLTIAAAGYDGVRDFTPLSGVANYYNALAVTASIGVHSMAELGQWLKAHPTESNYGIPATGSVPQLMGQLVGKTIGVSMNAVPYKGGAPMAQALLAGQVPMGTASLTDFIEHHRAGRLRILATSGIKRNPIAPDIPTFHELGYPGIEMNPWIAFFGPRGLSAEYVGRFDAAIKAVLADKELQDKLVQMGNEVGFAPGEQVRQWVTEGTRHWGQVLRDSGFKPQ